MAPVPQQTDEDVVAEQYDYGEETIVAVDLGPMADDASVEVVDGTAIVVLETADGPHQREIELPDDTARPTINNGVLTVEVTQE